MRILLQVVALCAVLSLCVCYDSHESSESAEDLFVSRPRAHSFIPPQRSPVYTPSRGSSPPLYNRRRGMKSAVEARVEACEDHYPCRYYAFRHGYQQAFQRYFNSRNQPQRPSGTRRY